ncbi:MAG: superinfection immunity protein [Deltaproteobacteria bacterium]|nr:superinfection immunity protein [Deltaproteobacteria bacterium]
MDPVLISFLPFLYFFPSLLDSIVNGQVRGYIFIVNLFFGWTIFYWAVCIYWVFRDFFVPKGDRL